MKKFAVEFDITIETPKENRNRYEIDRETGRIRLDHMLFTSTRYPDDYDFIDNTFGEDSDPLGTLVLLEEPIFPGCVIRCHAFDMLRTADEEGGDDKVLCVPISDQRTSWRTEIEDVSEFRRLKIQHLFEAYKNLEPGKSVGGAHWVGRKEAETETERSYERLKEHEAGHRELFTPRAGGHELRLMATRSLCLGVLAKTLSVWGIYQTVQGWDPERRAMRTPQAPSVSECARLIKRCA